MKTIKLIMGIAMAFSCGLNAQAQKVLVLYYSQTSNTKAVAQEIATKLNADIEEIVSMNPYSGDFKETIERCKNEQQAGIIPENKPLKADISKYDVIFLGYPIWFGTYAPPVEAFLNKANLSGKKVVPFCTFGSGGLESSVMNLASKQPNAEILEGYGVRAARMDAMPKEVDQFLKASGFLKGKYEKPGEFSTPHFVSDEEAAIFNAAVGDYPMMKNAKALTVASRAISDGTEYLFTATEKREGPIDPNIAMRPPREMNVYVIVVNGEKPVFTKVVR